MGKIFLKVVSIICTVFMLTTVLSGCGSNVKDTDSTVSEQSTNTSTEITVPNEFVTLKIVMPGDESARMTEFLTNEFAEKIKSDLNIELDVSFSPWSEYFNKIPMMLAAGEEIDWLWNGVGNVPSLVAKKFLLPLDDLFAANAPDLAKLIPKENLDAGRVNGKLMYIANTNTPTSSLFQTILAREDILEKIGITTIKSVEDLNKIATAVKNDSTLKTMNIFASDITNPLSRLYFDNPIYIPENTGIAIDLKANKVFSYFESEGYKKSAKQMEEWKNKGWINDDVTIKPNEYMNRMASGNYLFALGAISRPMEDINAVRANIPTAKYKEYLLNPDMPTYKAIATNNVLMISATSKHPDRAMQFINWMYKSKDNYNLCIYGVKDKDYTIKNDLITQVNKDSLFYEWMFRNVAIMDFPDNIDTEFIGTYKNWDNDAIISDILGFSFDSTTVSSESSKLVTVKAEKFDPISTGFVAFDNYYEDAVKSLKAAGIEKYVLEYQKQIDDFIASK